MKRTTTAARPNSASDSGAMGRRERSKLEKRARIVAAARALFASQGFEATTTQQITAAADIGAGTLFLYAKSKEDLLLMVFKEEMLATALDSFKKIKQSEPVVDQIMQVFERMIVYHERDLALTRILLKEVAIPSSPDRQEDLTELMTQIFAGFEGIIRRAQLSGGAPAHFDPQSAARAVFAFYYLGLFAWLGGTLSKAASLAQLRGHLEMLLDPHG